MNKVAFLDRDGTINVDHGYVYKIEDWAWIEGVVEGLRLLQNAGYILTVITNQSAIAQGSYTIEDMQRLHDFMVAELRKEGIEIAMVAFCPHARDQNECDCRKPKIGMAKHIEAQIGSIDYANSWTIGDKIADMAFGKNAGTKTALLRSVYWKDDNVKLSPEIIASSLLEAAQAIVATTQQ